MRAMWPFRSRPPRIVASEKCVAPSCLRSSTSARQSSGVPLETSIRHSIPIWIGGSAEPALKRTARLADGFFPQRPIDGDWPKTFDLFRGWVEEAGRDPERIGIEWRIDVSSGAPDDWRAEAEERKQLGATHFSLATMRGGLDIAGHIRRVSEAFEALQGL